MWLSPGYSSPGRWLCIGSEGNTERWLEKEKKKTPRDGRAGKPQSGSCDCGMLQLGGKWSGSVLQRAEWLLLWLNQLLCVSSCWCRCPWGDREVCREWTNPAIHGKRTGRINRAMHHSCSNHRFVADCIYWLIDCIDCLNWWKVQRQQTHTTGNENQKYI